MMKKSVMTYVLVFMMCLGLTSTAARATIVDAIVEWGVRLDSWESITCIAHYIPDTPDTPQSLIFQQVPEPTPTYTWGDWTGWETVISADQKMVYLYGPLNTNESDFDDVKWFSYNLYFQWDDADPDLDPVYPIYVDMVFFDGPLGSNASKDWFWKGKPGGWPDAWLREDHPHNPNHEEDYKNPIPEPVTICILGLGAVFVRKRR